MVHASGCTGVEVACSDLQNFEAQIQEGQLVAHVAGRGPHSLIPNICVLEILIPI